IESSKALGAANGYRRQPPRSGGQQRSDPTGCYGMVRIDGNGFTVRRDAKSAGEPRHHRSAESARTHRYCVSETLRGLGSVVTGMKTMRVARVPSAEDHRIEVVELPIPEPAPGTVRIHVEACGICHSDSITVNNSFSNISFPRSPGHEIAGKI